MLHLRVLSVALLAGCAVLSAGTRQLFVDDDAIAAVSGLRRVIHPVTKYEDNPIVLPPFPGTGSVAPNLFVEDQDSNKLVALTVNFGDHKRIIVAGMQREHADPGEIQAKQALFVVNLQRRKIHGVLSEGMLFDIAHSDGVTPVPAIPEKPVPDGPRAG